MNRILILLLTLVSCVLAQKTNCQKGGEYCLNHWDCCSNTCLSFLYKCSHIYSTDMQTVESPSLTSRISFDAPALSSATLSPETISYDSLLEIIFKPLKMEPTAVGRELNSIVPRLAETADEEKFTTTTEEDVINSTTDVPPCKEIGSKCYFNEDCCTKRCHGFLHQCVT